MQTLFYELKKTLIELSYSDNQNNDLKKNCKIKNDSFFVIKLK